MGTAGASARLRAALIGLQHGHMGSLDPAKPRGFLGTFRQLAAEEDFEIVALCEPHDAPALAREAAFLPGLRPYGSIEALLEKEEIAFAVVGLPAVDAAVTVRTLVEKGVHCFVEKSVARTAVEWRSVVEAAQRTGAHVLVDYPWRHHPAVKEARRLLDSGSLGKPTSILASMTTSQVGTLPGQRNPSGFAYRPETEGGGMLHWLGAHFLEAMCALFGDVRAVSAMCAPVVGNMDPDPRMDDVTSLSLLFQSGAVGALHTGYLNAAPAENRDFIRIWGTEGDAYWPSLGPALYVSRRSPPSGEPPTQTQTFELPERAGVYGNKEWMYELARSFVRGLRSGTPPEVGPAEGLRVLRIIDAAYESSQSGRRVELDGGNGRP